MFDELKKEQKVVCKILENAVKKEQYSHAYLFETNNQLQILILFLMIYHFQKLFDNFY